MSGSLASNRLWIFAGLIFASAAISYWNSSRKKKRSFLQQKGKRQDSLTPAPTEKSAAKASENDKKPVATAPHIDTLQSATHVKGRILEG